MNIKLILIAFLISATLTSYGVDIKTEKRDVPVFSKISLKIDADVTVKQGDVQSIEVTAKRTAHENLITSVKGRTLTIRYPNRTLFQKDFNPGKVKIIITVPDIDGLSVSGSGEIFSENIKSRIIDFALSGSGNIIVNELTSKKIKAAISGSGSLTIKGGAVADELSVSISGSGGVNAKNFEAKSVKASIAGSGCCYITSNGSIKASIVGSGSVLYKGNPAIESSVVGSGGVREL